MVLSSPGAVHACVCGGAAASASAVSTDQLPWSQQPGLWLSSMRRALAAALTEAGHLASPCAAAGTDGSGARRCSAALRFKTGHACMHACAYRRVCIPPCVCTAAYIISPPGALWVWAGIKALALSAALSAYMHTHICACMHGDVWVKEGAGGERERDRRVFAHV